MPPKDASLAPNIPGTTAKPIPMQIAQVPTTVNPEAAMPAILPAISSKGETEDNRTSITLVDFSSIVLVKSACELVNIAIHSR